MAATLTNDTLEMSALD